jgi:hypothetical protein
VDRWQKPPDEKLHAVYYSTALLMGILVLAAVPTAIALGRLFPRFSGGLLGPAMLVAAAVFLTANSRALFSPGDSWTGIGTAIIVLLAGLWCVVGVALTVTGFVKAQRYPAPHIPALQSQDPEVTHLTASGVSEFHQPAKPRLASRLLIAAVIVQLLLWLYIVM